MDGNEIRSEICHVYLFIAIDFFEPGKCIPKAK